MACPTSLRSFMRSTITVLLSYALLASSVDAQLIQQAAEVTNAEEKGLFGKLPSFPKTPAQFEQYLVMRGMARVLGNTLPIKLDADNTFPTIQDSALPGGPFQGKPFDLTTENVVQPLPPGDWIVHAVGFCQEYSVHQPGAGTAYKIGPLQGTKAELIATFLWRGVLAGKQPSELQLVEWAVESGVPYANMPKPYQADIDQLIPSYKEQLQGSWVDQIETKYQAIVTKPAEELKFAGAIPGIGMLIAKVLLKAMPLPPPTFGEFLRQYKMGEVADIYGDAKKLYAEFTQPYIDEQIRAQKLFEGQGSKLPPMAAQNGPWTVKANGVYMRFIVHGGNLHSDNELQIRVAQQQSTALRERNPHLVYASYDPQIAPTMAPRTTFLSLMGVSLAVPGVAVAGRTITALEVTELAGVVVSGAEIAFAVGVGAQALIIVLTPTRPRTPPIAPVVAGTSTKPWSNTGTCSESRWQYLQDQVNNTCKPEPGYCRPSESCESMISKITAFTNCGAARANINSECYANPESDPEKEKVRKDHQAAAAKAKQAADMCRGLLPTCVLP